MSKEITHEYTENIICPHCGYEFTDSWDISDDDGELDCYGCDKPFSFERIRTVEYITIKIINPSSTI